MKKYSLCGEWNMTGNGYRVKGQIPGSVYSFLYVDNGILPAPYYRDNEDIYLELSRHDYTFEHSFVYETSGASVSLVFDGLDTLCEVYLNGHFIAKTQNMHLRYTFDVSDKLLHGENRIRVICRSSTEYIKDRDAHSKLFGATDCMRGYPHLRKAHCMLGWDWGPRIPDAGIWREVYLVEKDSSEILDFDVVQRHDNGNVYLTPKIDFDGGDVTVTMTAPDGSVQTLIPNEENTVNSPELWWPNGLGEQNLYEMRAELREGGCAVDQRCLRVGLRELKLIRRQDEFGESFYHEINGIDMFAMGADYIPEDNIFSLITPERTRELLTECKRCNFNAIRVWGGGFYPDDSFFDICDELGLVVFFDLMFACSLYDPDEYMLESIRLEVEQNVKRISHHACLGLTCGNNEIEWHFHEYVSISGRDDREHLSNVYLDLFERIIPDIVRKVAPHVAYIPSSPTSSGGFRDPNGQASGDAHDWDSNHLSCRGRFYRYVSEFGFQSLPSAKTVEAFTKPHERSVNSRIMEKHQRSGGGNELILTQISRLYPYPCSFEELIYASQLAQVESVRYRVEHMRRNRGRCMGAPYWQLNDIWPGTSWSSIDYFGRYKALQYAAKRFFAPILLSCEETGELQTFGSVNAEKGSVSEEYGARLCVTNDTRSAVKGTVRWELRDKDSGMIGFGESEVEVDPMSAKYVTSIKFDDIDVTGDHLYFELSVDGKTVSDGSALFCAPKHYAFEDPKLCLKVDGDEIVVRSEAFAMAVRIENESGDLVLSDNYFSMEAGEKRVRVLSGDTVGLAVSSVYGIG